MTTTPQAALLSEADMLDCLREATHEIPTRIPPGWRKVMQAAEKRILAKLQDGRNTPFGREAEKLADNYLDLQAQYADAVAKLQATQELAQAGSASLLDGCKSIMDSIAVSSSVIEHNKQAEPVQAGELPTPFGYVSDGFQDGLHFQHKPWPEMHMLLNSVAQVYSAAQMRAAIEEDDDKETKGKL